MGYQEIKKLIMLNYVNNPLDTLEIKQEDVIDLKEEEMLDLLLLNISLNHRIIIIVDDGWRRTLREHFKPVYYKYRLLLE